MRAAQGTGLPERARNMAGRTCPICGKVLRSGSEEAMSAHQRESQSCRPQANRSDSTSVKALEAKLASVIAEGKALGKLAVFRLVTRLQLEVIMVSRLTALSLYFGVTLIPVMLLVARVRACTTRSSNPLTRLSRPGTS